MGRYLWQMRSLSLLVLLACAAAPLRAQDIPQYVPLNPALSSRSALYAQPIVSPSRGWQVRIVTDYTNAIESEKSSDNRDYLFDAEVMQNDLWVTKELSPTTFVLGNIAVRGGYDGMLDSFLNWYHDVIGLHVPARNRRPKDTFGWEQKLPDGRTITRERPGTFLSDLRLGAGVRFGRSQLVGTITLPTTTTDQEGWGRDVVGTAINFTSRLAETERIIVDGGVSLGWTPTTGALAAYQKSAFYGGMLGARWRFSGSQAVFGNIAFQSGNWQETGWSALDGRETTLDFGGLFRLKRAWPELQVGMSQDIAPHGPAMDVGFKLGLRW